MRALITIETDFDRSQHGTPWEADEDVPKHEDSDLKDYASSLQVDWDHPPFLRVVSVKRMDDVPDRD